MKNNVVALPWVKQEQEPKPRRMARFYSNEKVLVIRSEAGAQPQFTPLEVLALQMLTQAKQEPKKPLKKAYRPKTKNMRFAPRKDVPAFNALGHLIIGTALGLLIATSPLYFALVLLGSLLPDIDHPRSTLGRWNPFARFMRHRGHCHSIMGIVLLSLPFLAFGGLTPFYMVLAGAASHLLGDKLHSWLPKKRGFQVRLW